ncbi:T-complex protein 1 subunit beta [Camellia lanceoleosa]|uniref:T-complex protein 1 subunit beta n=1 Tax=Camellia lanceoleosa TaxID=1840588 RepID=A0ACC0ID86_9ERIC|nr:T-complex protein 1 subunit beta [Camellia lanceoleosa]
MGQACTIVLRGASNHVLDEAERSLHDALCVLSQEVAEKVQANQLQTISYVEEKVLQTLCEKEAEVENINKKNMELELRMEQLAVEAAIPLTFYVET